jgi:hypothetical protein
MKYAALTFFVAFLLALTGCGKDQPQSSTSAPTVNLCFACQPGDETECNTHFLFFGCHCVAKDGSEYALTSCE